jgi:hypothetical protein
MERGRPEVGGDEKKREKREKKSKKESIKIRIKFM